MPQPFAEQFRAIAMSPSLAASLERAHEFAREQGHRAVTLEHLLLAFTEDPDASAVLQASNVDLLRLGTDVSGYLGRLLDDMRATDGADPQSDPELMRVLHAAVQAAQQSRRRQIDGAIVLAAVVGDGKSPAAGLLKAHGMTFEEAIKALQKANAKANAQARSRQFATQAPPPAAPETAEPPTMAAPEPAAAPAPESSGQTVDEILAAARARIQQRSASTPERKAPPELAKEPAARPPDPQPQLSTLDDTRTGPVRPPDPPLTPPEPPLAHPPQATTRQPPPPPPQPAASAPSSPSARMPPAPAADRPPAPARPPARPGAPPQAHRPLQAGEASSRPPLPPVARGTGPGAPPLPGLPGRVVRTPWPAPDTPQALNGAHGEAPLPQPRRPSPGQRTGGQPGQGPLVETIPRRMRTGVPAAAQVRIGRDRVDSLIMLLMKGRGLTHRPEALASRSLSVRLKAPEGGFWIEPASPETQWADAMAVSHQPEDQITWRWTVTPQHRGRGRLVLVVTVRTVGQDGLATEASAPDRVIEVTASGGRLRGVGRWIGLVAALGIGALAGRFGGELWAIGTAVIRRVLG